VSFDDRETGSGDDDAEPPDSDPRIGPADPDRSPEEPVLEDDESAGRRPSVSRRTALGVVGAGGTIAALGAIGVVVDGSGDRERAREALRDVARERADGTGTLIDDVQGVASDLADGALGESGDPGAVLSDRVAGTEWLRSAHLLERGTILASSREGVVGESPGALPVWSRDLLEGERAAYAVAAGEPLVGTAAAVGSGSGEYVYVIGSLGPTTAFAPPVDGAVTYLLRHGIQVAFTRILYDSRGRSQGGRYPPELALEVVPFGMMMPEDDDEATRTSAAEADPNVVRAEPTGTLADSVPADFRDEEHFVVHAVARGDLAVVLHAPVSTAVDRFGDDGRFF